MNTEFPSRVPTVSTTQKNVNTTKEILSSIDIQQVSDKTLQKIVGGIIKDLKDMVSGINLIIHNQNQKKEDDAQKRKEDNKKHSKLMKTLITIGNEIKGIFTDLKNSIGRFASSLNDSIGAGLSSIFGGGKFGELVESTYLFLTKTLWKGITWVGNILSNLLGKMGRILKEVSLSLGRVMWGLTKMIATAAKQLFVSTVGFLLSPSGLLLMGILVAVGLIVYYAEEIWDGIKWLGYMLDQAFTDAISLIPGVSNKYDKAYEAESQKLGIDTAQLSNIIGNSTRTRNIVYEANKGNTEAQAELAELFARKNAEYMSRMLAFNKYGSSMNLMDAQPSNMSQLPQMIRDVTVNNKIENTTMFGTSAGMQTMDEMMEGLNKSIANTFNTSSVKTTNNYGSKTVNTVAPGAAQMDLYPLGIGSNR